jgi:hypothetical protein
MWRTVEHGEQKFPIVCRIRRLELAQDQCGTVSERSTVSKDRLIHLLVVNDNIGTPDDAWTPKIDRRVNALVSKQG